MSVATLPDRPGTPGVDNAMVALIVAQINARSNAPVVGHDLVSRILGALAITEPPVDPDVPGVMEQVARNAGFSNENMRLAVAWCRTVLDEFRLLYP